MHFSVTQMECAIPIPPLAPTIPEAKKNSTTKTVAPPPPPPEVNNRKLVLDGIKNAALKRKKARKTIQQKSPRSTTIIKNTETSHMDLLKKRVAERRKKIEQYPSEKPIDERVKHRKFGSDDSDSLYKKVDEQRKRLQQQLARLDYIDTDSTNSYNTDDSDFWDTDNEPQEDIFQQEHFYYPIADYTVPDQQDFWKDYKFDSIDYFSPANLDKNF